MKKIITLIFLLASLSTFAQPGRLDNVFISGEGTDNAILSMVKQPDGKMLIGGLFTTYNSTTVNNIVRINADGSLDNTFSSGGTGANSLVYVLALQPNGKIFATGFFDSYNGVPRNKIVRINSDGTLDADFDPGTGLDVAAHSFLTLSNGKVIIAGLFTKYNGTDVNYIARVEDNGSLDNTFNYGGVGANGPIYKVLRLEDDRMIIVGGFTAYNGTSVNGIARINANGTLDNTFNPGSGVDNSINTVIALPNDQFLIAGNFTSYNGTSANNIARINFNGDLDVNFNVGGAGANGVIYTLVERPNGKLLVGGQFSNYNSQSSPGIVSINANGTLDASFNPGTGATQIYDIALQPNGRAVITGAFTQYNSESKNFIAGILTDWAPDNDGTLYVKKGANGNGSSWQNAIPELATALVAASSINGTNNQHVNRIFVAKGTYKPMYSAIDGDNFTPNPTDPRDKAFLMVEDVNIYGGFDPDNNISTLADNRIPPSLTTGSILSGDFNDNDVISGHNTTLNIANNTENAYHIVIANGILGTLELNGFALVGGNAQESENTSATINSVPVYRHSGGGVYVDGVSLILRNLLITGNVATYGAGLRTNSSTLKLLNTAMVKNYSRIGGAFSTGEGFTTIANCTIAGNGGIEGSRAAHIGLNDFTSITNSIVWGGIIFANVDYSASYSLIQGNTNINNNDGNINATGLSETDIFLNAAGGIYTLKDNTNVAFDKGSNSLYTDAGGNLNTDRDLVGNPRLRNITIDMGAYELQEDPSVLPVSFGKFTAVAQSGRVKLEWNTFSENSNQLFTIYRSSNITNYTPIATQASKGREANVYTVFDNQPANGINYYRLTQKDIDGKVTVLANAVVNFSLSDQNVKIWPNPIIDLLNVSFASGTYQKIVLTNLNGQKLQTLDLQKTQNSVQLNVAGYAKGLYVVQLIGNNNTRSMKVLK